MDAVVDSPRMFHGYAYALIPLKCHLDLLTEG
jgi:hypothetical protein